MKTVVAQSVRNLQKKMANPNSNEEIQSNDLNKPVLKLSQSYKGHKDTINSVSLHISEPVFATGSSDSTIRIYDYEL